MAHAVKHKPRGPLSHAKIPLQFVAADTVLAIGNQPRCGKPFIKANRRIFKDCPNLHRELLFRVNVLALPAALSRNVVRAFRATRRAFDAIRPADITQELRGQVLIREVNDRFLQGFG